MKKKTIIIITIVSLVVLLSVILILVKIFSGKWTKLFANSDYPAKYTHKENTIVLKMDGTKSKDTAWDVVIEDPDVVEVTADSKESGGKMTYVLTAKNQGATYINFSKQKEIFGVKYYYVTLHIPVITGKDENGNAAINIDDNTAYISGSEDIVADNTNYPFLVGNGLDSAPAITFLNGKNDWTLEYTGSALNMRYSKDDAGRDVIYFAYTGDSYLDVATVTDASVSDAPTMNVDGKNYTMKEFIEGMASGKVEYKDYAKFYSSYEEEIAKMASMTDASMTDASMTDAYGRVYIPGTSSRVEADEADEADETDIEETTVSPYSMEALDEMYFYDASAADAQERDLPEKPVTTAFTMTSESLGISQNIYVIIDVDGSIYLGKTAK